MSARSTPRIPSQAPPPEEVERDVARTADLVLKLAALADRYEAGSASAERVAAMQEVVRRGRRRLAALAGLDGAELQPALAAGGQLPR